MTRLIIELPDDLKAKLVSRAAAAGHASLERYVQSVLQTDAEGGQDLGAPAHLGYASSTELERKIEEGVHSGPAVEVTESFWERLKGRADVRQSRTGKP